MKKFFVEVAALFVSIALLFTVSFGGMTVMTGCAWFKSESKVAETSFVNCAKVDLTVGSLLSDTSTVLKNGTAGWETSLDSLGIKYGTVALTCAVKAVEDVFASSLPAGSASHAEPSPVMMRADAYLSARGVKFQ